MRLAFLGTPEPPYPRLRALVDAGHDVALVITRPDRRRGRGSATVAQSRQGGRAGARACTWATTLSDLDGLDVERGVVVAYGALIRAPVLEDDAHAERALLAAAALARCRPGRARHPRRR